MQVPKKANALISIESPKCFLYRSDRYCYLVTTESDQYDDIGLLVPIRSLATTAALLASTAGALGSTNDLAADLLG